ncbi:RNA polymerase sigma (70) factor [Arthrobacter sp. PAMC 25486]|uniref:RNA polymerase sigma factor n=1 Tax=Arthrobacter sp. PAMC 25486 TaxID=1494608 RepID=UPI000535F8EA|nr:sigma-70 family RNA polymerase sigma factor [Arthrobacter sp. PAMC 25486]AIY02837.1 RNA polymerase sigma (70) factor [Arthrobacter sp. PAMC 25486]
MTTDSGIIRSSGESPHAFTALYDKFARMIYRYAARRAGESAAEDVMAETFLVAFERRDSFDHAWEDARPWLFGIATNLLRKHHRTEAKVLKIMAKASGREGYADSTERIAEQLDAAAATSSLAGALRKLSAGDRECILLYAWAELSYEGIAAATKVPIGTVRSRLNRARRILKDAAGAHLDNTEEADHGRSPATA